ncbi:MAG TPA: hypothetical protein DIT04_12680 [Dysgonomonas sp.]|nr:hypothetical protein [Dysgonomonas sp.]
MEEKEYLKRCLTDKIIKDISIFFDEIPVNELIDYLCETIIQNKDKTDITYGIKLISFICTLEKDTVNKIIQKH